MISSSSAPARRAACSRTGCRHSPQNRVLLIEAGGSDRSPLIQVPAGNLIMLRRGTACWKYLTDPQTASTAASSTIRAASCSGGTSSINGMIYDAGLAEDFDRWQSRGNAAGPMRSAAVLQAQRDVRVRRERIITAARARCSSPARRNGAPASTTHGAKRACRLVQVQHDINGPGVPGSDRRSSRFTTGCA